MNRRQLNAAGRAIGMRPEPRKAIDPDVPDKTDPAGKSHSIYNGAWRIGDVYIFGSQCELCSPIGLRIKRELRDYWVWTCGYTHWGGGYIVDAAQFPEGGYEVNNSVCAPETEDILAANAARYVQELRQTPIHRGEIPEVDTAGQLAAE